ARAPPTTARGRRGGGRNPTRSRPARRVATTATTLARAKRPRPDTAGATDRAAGLIRTWPGVPTTTACTHGRPAASNTKAAPTAPAASTTTYSRRVPVSPRHLGGRRSACCSPPPSNELWPRCSSHRNGSLVRGGGHGGVRRGD